MFSRVEQFVVHDESVASPDQTFRLNRDATPDAHPPVPERDVDGVAGDVGDRRTTERFWDPLEPGLADERLVADDLRRAVRRRTCRVRSPALTGATWCSSAARSRSR